MPSEIAHLTDWQINYLYFSAPAVEKKTPVKFGEKVKEHYRKLGLKEEWIKELLDKKHEQQKRPIN